MAQELPSIETLRKLLRYEPDTGKLFWLHRPVEFFCDDRSWKIWNTRYAETETASKNDGHGYRRLSIFDKDYQAHRIAWALHHGKWPSLDIDHKNGIGHDNRIKNLRDVSKVINHRNKKQHSNNTSGYNGVSWHKPTQKWKAYIVVNGINKHLGRFASIEDAIAARQKAERGLGFTNRHGSITRPISIA